MAKRALRRRPLVAGNWKMNGLRRSRREIVALARMMSKAPVRCDVMLCPPATLLIPFREIATGSKIRIGAQDCHVEEAGAHTGDLSAEMLKDAGARAVIVGHSERRADHGETDAIVRAKAESAHRAGLVAIVCVGETAAQRDGGATLRVVGAQVKGSLPSAADASNTVVAYEPVWAIGTGRTPTSDDIAKVHAHIRKKLAAIVGDEPAAAMRILYGGSVKPGNAEELMAIDNVDGALVGGASLAAVDFFGIASACR